jgi:hypothetical protein
MVTQQEIYTTLVLRSEDKNKKGVEEWEEKNIC